MHAEPSSLSQSSAKIGVVGAYIVYGEHGCTGQAGFDMHSYYGQFQDYFGYFTFEFDGTCNTNIFLLELRELATSVYAC